MTETTTTDRYTQSTASSRHDRNTSRDALHDLENALSSPAPGRRPTWLHDVDITIDNLLEALASQAGTDADTASLLSEIAADQPRLARRVAQLRADHHDIVDELRAVRHLIHEEPDDLNVRELRDQLADTARRLRRHRAQEADLVYEAINVDLGAGD